MEINEIIHEDFDACISTEIENLEEIVESLRNNDLSQPELPYRMSKEAAAGIVSLVRIVKAVNGGSKLATDIFLGMEIDDIINPKKVVPHSITE